MTEEIENMKAMALDREIEDTIHQIILACGTRPFKEKVTMLYLTIDYIFEQNKHLIPLFSDLVTLH